MTGKGAASNGKGRLHLIAPSDIRFKDFAANGLIVPQEMDDKEAYAPLDFTSESSKIVGQQNSYWTVRFSHLVFLVGVLDSDLGNLKHDLKMKEAEWRRKNEKNFTAKYKADDAMWRNKEIKRMRTQVARAESSLKKYNALLESYRALREAASREITRRTQERAPKD